MFKRILAVKIVARASFNINMKCFRLCVHLHFFSLVDWRCISHSRQIYNRQSLNFPRDFFVMRYYLRESLFVGETRHRSTKYSSVNVLQQLHIDLRLDTRQASDFTGGTAVSFTRERRNSYRIVKSILQTLIKLHNKSLSQVLGWQRKKVQF